MPIRGEYWLNLKGTPIALVKMFTRGKGEESKAAISNRSANNIKQCW